MKALKIFYALVWIYVVYYSAYMIHRVLGEDAYPLFIAIGLLYIIRGIVNFIILKSKY